MRGAGLRFLWQPGDAACFSAMAAAGGPEQGEMHLKGRPGAAARSVTWTHVINPRTWAFTSVGFQGTLHIPVFCSCWSVDTEIGKDLESSYLSLKDL